MEELTKKKVHSKQETVNQSDELICTMDAFRIKQWFDLNPEKVRMPGIGNFHQARQREHSLSLAEALVWGV